MVVTRPLKQKFLPQALIKQSNKYEITNQKLSVDIKALYYII